jgi:L-rhamnose mutarotase
MKNMLKWGIIVMVLMASVSLGGGKAQKPNPIKQVGMVVGIKPDRIAEYTRLHTGDNCPVRDLLNKYHMHNFSIFLHQIDGRWYEFGYYEYTGDDFEGDMAKLAAEPRNQEWLKVCDPMQIPLKGEKSWATMERVFYNP